MSEFVKIKNYEYFINSEGVLRNSDGKEIKPNISHDGYFFVGLYKNGYRKRIAVHRLVAISFIPNPENKETVNHKNGIKSDNRVENLEWNTRSENELHSFRVLGKKAYQPMKNKFGSEHNRSKCVIQISQCGHLINFYGSAHEATRETGINVSNILSCVNGKRKKAGGYLWM